MTLLHQHGTADDNCHPPSWGQGRLPHPQGIAVLENGATITLYVANPGDNSVSIIDATHIKTGTFTQIARLTAGIGPTPIEVAIQNGDAYVLNNNQGGVGTISTISTGTNAIVAQTITVGHNASGLAPSPDGLVLYIAIAAVSVSPLLSDLPNLAQARLPESQIRLESRSIRIPPIRTRRASPTLQIIQPAQ